jgi:hypothetical protein
MMIFLAGVILADFLALFTIHDGDMTLSGRRRKRANRGEGSLIARVNLGD